MSSDLEVVVLHHVIQNFNYVNFGSELLAFVLSFAAQGEIHEKSGCVLHGVVRQGICAG